MAESITVVIPGVPVPKARTRGTNIHGYTHYYTPAKSRKYEDRITGIAKREMNGRPPLEGAVTVRLMLSMPVPASWSKRKRLAAIQGHVLPWKRPDIDNLIKSIFDAFNKVVFIDDAQITDLTVTKRYAVVPGVVCTTAAIEDSV